MKISIQSCTVVLCAVLNYTVGSRQYDLATLCRKDNRAEVTLGHGINSAALFFLQFSQPGAFECEVFFRKPEDDGHGYIGIVQSLSLPRLANGTCISYVQINSQQKHCTNTKDTRERYYTASNISVFFFKVVIPDYNISGEFFDPLEVMISVTMIQKDCDGENIKCRYTDYCISKLLVNDGVMNCPHYSCPDETEVVHCKELKLIDANAKPTPKPFTRNGTTLTITALTSMFIVFTGLIVCMWTCKKFGMICFAPALFSDQRQEVELSRSQAEVSTPSAPTPAPAPTDDKDLPPSYESLFPTHI